MSDTSDFPSFFASFLAAARAGDAAFAKATLPPTLADDHFAFLLQMRTGMIEEVDENKAEPTMEIGPERCVVRYQWKEGEDDGEVGLELPFYRLGDRWVCYDPKDPEFA